MARRRLAEAGLAQAFAHQPFQVDVGVDQVRVVGKARRFGQQLPVLADQRLAVPGQVGGRFALARRRIQVRRQAARRLRGGQRMAVGRLAHRDVRGRQVEQQRRAGQRRVGRGRDRHPQVLADLGVEDEARQVRRLEQQLGAEGHVLAQQPQLRALRMVGRVELARLVELAVVRQVGLGHDAQQPAAVHDRGAVEQRMVHAQRQPHHRHRGQAFAGGDDARQRRFAAVEQRALVEQVVAGVGRQPQLGKDHQRRALLRGLLQQRDALLGVEGRVGDAAARHRHRHAGEALAVQVEELCGFGHGRTLLA